MFPASPRRSRRLEDVVYQRRRGRLAVAARDAHHLGVGVAAGKLYLADDVNALFDGLPNHRRFLGNARTLDDFVRIEDGGFRMAPFLPRDGVVVEQLLVLVLDDGHVRNEDIEAFLLGEHSGSGTAFSRSQHYYSFHISICNCPVIIYMFPKGRLSPYESCPLTRQKASGCRLKAAL